MRTVVYNAIRLVLLASLVAPASAFAVSADLFVELMHANPFAQGETGQTYQVVVRNRGGASSSGTVSVTDTLQSGLTATAIAGAGWVCNTPSLSCSRSDALAAGTSYPAITVTVTVAANAPPEVVNSASVSGGGDASPGNNTAIDRTTIWNTTICHEYDLFGGGVSYPVGGVSSQLAVADFNGDGIPDVVTVNQGDGISVLFGMGDGRLAAATSYFPGSDYSAVEAVDLDRDGALDLAVLSYRGKSLITFLGQGDGTFVLRESRAIGWGQWRLTANDFNGDSFADLAVTQPNDEELLILIGNGDGTMRDPAKLYAGDGQYDVVSGDFDGDRIPDLAVTVGFPAYLHIASGVGDGTFRALVDNYMGLNPIYIAAGDLNGDGTLDLAAASWLNPWVFVRLGNGDGSFSPPTTYTTSSSSISAITIEDANADGKADIVVSRADIEILPGNGDGTFGAAEFLAWSNFDLHDVAVADLDRDGAADLLATHDSSLMVQRAGCTDLAITKSHTGDFRVGQTGATYTLVVKNAGISTITDWVIVTDSMPAGLTARSMSGQGWTCDSATSCSRFGTLEPFAELPPIIVTVDVSAPSPTNVTNVAHVLTADDGRPENDSASDVTSIVSGVDLAITTSHPSACAPNWGVCSYQITVRNEGVQTSNGAVIVADQLPACMTAVSLRSNGSWACDLPSLRCLTTSPLAAGASYQPIDLSATVSPNCPSMVTNVATVSGGGDASPSNNTASDPTFVFGKPTGVVAQAIGTNAVRVTWNPVPGATSYAISHSPNIVMNYWHGNSTASPWIDTPVFSGSIGYYRVAARADSAFGPWSDADVALTVGFTDDPIIAGSTEAKAVHLTELRSAVNLLRAEARLGNATFTDPSPAGLPIRAIHILELRDRLNEARRNLGVIPREFSFAPLSPGIPIKASDVQELREAIR